MVKEVSLCALRASMSLSTRRVSVVWQSEYINNELESRVIIAIAAISSLRILCHLRDSHPLSLVLNAKYIL